MGNSVCLEQDGAIAVVRLNRPEKLNAINEDLIGALDDALEAVSSLDAVRIVILCGAGRAFCAGNDLEGTEAALAEGLDATRLREGTKVLQRITQRISEDPRLYIGAIQGWAVGAGLEWAINCDFTVWGQSARAFFPEVSLGVFPTGGVLTLLPKIVGLQRARQMLFLGKKYDATELLSFGLATEVVADEDVHSRARGLAEELLTLPLRNAGRLKSALARTPYLDLEETLAMEAQELVNAMLSQAQ